MPQPSRTPTSPHAGRTRRSSRSRPRDDAGARRWPRRDFPTRSPRNRLAGWSSAAIGSPKRSGVLSQRREELARRQAELDRVCGAGVRCSFAADAGRCRSPAAATLCSTSCTSLPRPPRGRRRLSSAARRFAVSGGAFVPGKASTRRRSAARNTAAGSCSSRSASRTSRSSASGRWSAPGPTCCGGNARRSHTTSKRPWPRNARKTQFASSCEADYPGLLEGRSGELRQRLAGIQEQLHGLLEKRGRLSGQLESLAADRRMASKQLDLAVLEKRLEDAVHRWQVLATTCRILDVIREAYQQHRQPETLQEASVYLDRLTQGHYRRVWTPLGDRSLRVDDAQGRALPVESLSRGTREQLFLSLRLALASSYARRGSPLPLVLDDVLVNFDAERAKAAAAVLRDFAAEGHQLLVFTCHEHILKLFKSLKVPVSQLPNNAEPGPAVIVLQSHAEDDEKPKREKPPRPPRRKTAAKQETPEPADGGFREDGTGEEIDDVDEVADEDDSLWEGEDDEEFDGLDDSAAA